MTMSRICVSPTWNQARLTDNSDGSVLVSGDPHFGELLRIQRPGSYPLYEYTTSPLTAGVFTNLPAAERYNPDLVAGTLVLQRNFGCCASVDRGARVCSPSSPTTLTASYCGDTR